MNKKALSQTNVHLKQGEKQRRNRVRSLASSTAIETGQSIKKLEEKIMGLQNGQTGSACRVTLA